MFERIAGGIAEPVTILVDGRSVPARATDTVVAALLAAGMLTLRVNAADGAPRGPWCLMGVCQDCRVVVDDEPDIRACTTAVREGMRISLGGAARDG